MKVFWRLVEQRWLVRTCLDPADQQEPPRFEWVPRGTGRFLTARAARLFFVRSLEPDLVTTSDDFTLTHWPVLSRQLGVRVSKEPTP